MQSADSSQPGTSLSHGVPLSHKVPLPPGYVGATVLRQWFGEKGAACDLLWGSSESKVTLCQCWSHTSALTHGPMGVGVTLPVAPFLLRAIAEFGACVYMCED